MPDKRMLTFQQIILKLQSYWDAQGCALLQPYDMEVGAGTSHTATFLRAIREVFGDTIPPFSSTKSLTGHSLGATGVQEAIYCLLMLRQGFIAGSANIETLEPAAEGMPLVRKTVDAPIRTALSNSFGFGGTNASLVLRRWES